MTAGRGRRRLGLAIATVAGLWAAAIGVGDCVAGRITRRETTERLEASLGGSASVADADLALLRGRFTLDGLAVRRDDVVGHLALDVASVRCELRPLGLAALDHACSVLAVRGTRLEVSAAGLLALHSPKHPPLRVGRVEIDDAAVVFMPSSLLPDLGRVEIHVDHAAAGRTVMRTPLSWLLELHELDARVLAPGGVTVQIHYLDGLLSASGSLLGARPIALPEPFPVAALAKDGHEELRLLVDYAKRVAERLVEQRAEDWLRDKLR